MEAIDAQASRSSARKEDSSRIDGREQTAASEQEVNTTNSTDDEFQPDHDNARRADSDAKETSTEYNESNEESTETEETESEASVDAASTRRAEEEDSGVARRCNPVPKNGMVEFDADSIKGQVVCQLCEGLYREPYTTIKCRHTFCKSCLGAALYSGLNREKGSNCCPSCDTYLGRFDELSSVALPDRVLETLIDKVLFPDIASADHDAEANFYRKRGIKPKQPEEHDEQHLQRLYEQKSKKQRTDAFGNPIRQRASEDMVTFQLVPEQSDGKRSPPPLKLPFLRTKGGIRMGQLKKYLKRKLKGNGNTATSVNEAAALLVGMHNPASELPEPDPELEILCLGNELGNELSVTFVLRTVWMDTAKNLTLTYRYAK